MIRFTARWQDYELLDAGGGFRLERWGKVLLQRPDPQVIWQTPRQSPAWQQVDAVYHRSEKGGGNWEYRRSLPEEWMISYPLAGAGLPGDETVGANMVEHLGEGNGKNRAAQLGGTDANETTSLQTLRLVVSPTGFKHTGVFPEQAVNWDVYARLLQTHLGTSKAANATPPKVLNLFGYTGGATLACAAAGAQVTHVDASKGMVAWARRNAGQSGLAEKPIRWMVDDCQKFVARELRRGNRYDAVIMDPPSYGRGPGGEVWKLEEAIWPLLELNAQVLCERPLFFALNSYTTGLAAGVGGYMLRALLQSKFGGSVHSGEIGLPVTAGGGVLPCGATAMWLADGLAFH